MASWWEKHLIAGFVTATLGLDRCDSVSATLVQQHTFTTSNNLVFNLDTANMGGKKAPVENSKKVAGNAKKAEAAAAKKGAEDQKKAAAESAEWQKGSKDGSKA